MFWRPLKKRLFPVAFRELRDPSPRPYALCSPWYSGACTLAGNDSVAVVSELSR